MNSKEQFEALGYYLTNGSIDRGFLNLRKNLPSHPTGFAHLQININLERAVFSKISARGDYSAGFVPFEEDEARACVSAFDEYNARKEVK